MTITVSVPVTTIDVSVSSNDVINVELTTGSLALSSLSDVTVSSVADNDFLIYNSTTSVWENVTAANSRTAMGLGTLATQNANNVALTGGTSTDVEMVSYIESVTTVAASGTTETLDVGTSSIFDVTLSDNCEFTFSGATASKAASFTLLLKQDGSGGHTTTWPNSVEWAGGTAPSLTTTANAKDILVFSTLDGGTTWYGGLFGAAFS